MTRQERRARSRRTLPDPCRTFACWAPRGRGSVGAMERKPETPRPWLLALLGSAVGFLAVVAAGYAPAGRSLRGCTRWRVLGQGLRVRQPFLCSGHGDVRDVRQGRGPYVQGGPHPLFLDRVLTSAAS